MGIFNVQRDDLKTLIIKVLTVLTGIIARPILRDILGKKRRKDRNNGKR